LVSSNNSVHASVSVFIRGGAWHSYSCGQKVGWIKMPLGKEVGLGPGHIVLDGDPVGTQPPSSPSPLSVHAYCGQTVAISATAEHLFSKCHLLPSWICCPCVGRLTNMYLVMF